MAIIMRGKSKCRLCGEVLDASAQIVAFAAFLPATHELSRYSDAAFHAECFAKWSEREQFEKLYRRYQEIWSSRPMHLTSPSEIDAWGNEAFREFHASE